MTAAVPCRITTLASRGNHRAPFTLRTSCGWTTQVEQGVAWWVHPARRLWLAHPCRLRDTA